MANEFHAAADAMLDPEVLADHRRVRSLTAKRLALQPVAERWDAWRAAEREARTAGAAELERASAGATSAMESAVRERDAAIARREATKQKKSVCQKS
jgi:hypothetical protein